MIAARQFAAGEAQTHPTDLASKAEKRANWNTQLALDTTQLCMEEMRENIADELNVLTSKVEHLTSRVDRLEAQMVVVRAEMQRGRLEAAMRTVATIKSEFAIVHGSIVQSMSRGYAPSWAQLDELLSKYVAIGGALEALMAHEIYTESFSAAQALVSHAGDAFRQVAALLQALFTQDLTHATKGGCGLMEVLKGAPSDAVVLEAFLPKKTHDLCESAMPRGLLLESTTRKILDTFEAILVSHLQTEIRRATSGNLCTRAEKAALQSESCKDKWDEARKLPYWKKQHYSAAQLCRRYTPRDGKIPGAPTCVEVAQSSLKASPPPALEDYCTKGGGDKALFTGGLMAFKSQPIMSQKQSGIYYLGYRSKTMLNVFPLLWGFALLDAPSTETMADQVGIPMPSDRCVREGAPKTKDDRDRDRGRRAPLGVTLKRRMVTNNWRGGPDSTRRVCNKEVLPRKKCPGADTSTTEADCMRLSNEREEQGRDRWDNRPRLSGCCWDSTASNGQPRCFVKEADAYQGISASLTYFDETFSRTQTPPFAIMQKFVIDTGLYRRRSSWLDRRRQVHALTEFNATSKNIPSCRKGIAGCAASGVNIFKEYNRSLKNEYKAPPGQRFEALARAAERDSNFATNLLLAGLYRDLWPVTQRLQMAFTEFNVLTGPVSLNDYTCAEVRASGTKKRGYAPGAGSHNVH